MQWEDDAFRYLPDAPFDDGLFHLKVGNAVTQQATRLSVLLVNVDRVADTCELLGCGEARRARADDCNPFAGRLVRRVRRNPAFHERLVGNGAFDRLDGDRLVVDVELASGFARCRAHTPRNLGKIVGRVQIARGRLPMVMIDEVVPVWDLIVHRTAVVTIWIPQSMHRAAWTFVSASDSGTTNSS